MWGQAEWKRGCWLRIGKLGWFCTALETLVCPATAGYWVYFPGADIWLIITFVFFFLRNMTVHVLCVRL